MLRWMDGFEHYGTDETIMEAGVGGGAAWSQIYGWTLSTTNPATGTYHMRCVADINTDQVMRRALGQSSQISGLGYRFAVADLPDTESSSVYVEMASFRDVGNGEQHIIKLGTEGSIHAIGAGLDHRSDPCVAAGGYHHFEAKTKIANTGGYVEVRINEVTVLNVTGVDTQTTANAETSQVRVGLNPLVTSTVSTTMDLDDIFAWDDDATDSENTVVDWVGDKGCYYLKPNADTATSDFTINASATAYGALDEVPPNGTDYLDDTTGTARTIVGVESLPGNVSEVIAMMPVIYARKEESGTVNLRGGVVVGTDESYTPTNSPSTVYAYMEPGCKTIDPSTGVAWANDAEPSLLIERTA